MVLEVNHISKLYKKKRGVNDVSFNVDQGEIFGLLGPNGSGKTTLMKIITGLTRAQSGDIKIFDYDITDETANALSEVGAIIEAPAAIPYLSAYDNLKFVAAFYPNPYDVNDILDLVGLSNVKKDKVHKFSLGMKQRMGIALAIIGRPKLLVLDEPTNGLDIEGTVNIRNVILDLAKNEATILISSHLSAELQLICTKVGVMRESNLLKIDSMDYVNQNYNSLEDYYIDIVKQIEVGEF